MNGWIKDVDGVACARSGRPEEKQRKSEKLSDSLRSWRREKGMSAKINA
jgi:hypothetical protein